MYKLDDLNAMDENQLKSVAESMNIKKADSFPQEELVYKILDKQAEDLASSAGEKKRRVKEPKAKKGEGEQVEQQKKKKKQPQAQAQDSADSGAQPSQQEAPVAEAVAEPAKVEAPRRKRGRPSKQQKEAEAAAANREQAAADVSEPKAVNDTPELPVKEQEEDHRDQLTLMAPLPLADKEEAVAGLLPENSNTAVEQGEPSDEPLTGDRQRQEEPNQGERRRDFRPGKDSTFGSFFRSDSHGSDYYPGTRTGIAAAT